MLIEKKNIIFILAIFFIFSLTAVKMGDFSGYAILNKCYGDCDKGLNICKSLVGTSFALCANSADINYKACREKSYTDCVEIPFKECLKPKLQSCFEDWKFVLKNCESNAETSLSSCSDNLLECTKKC